MVLKKLVRNAIDIVLSSPPGDSLLRASHGQSQMACLVRRFLSDPAWDTHGIDQSTRRRIYERIRACQVNIAGHTRIWAHMLYLTEILRVPPSVEGDVIEFGCYKGASTASLSIACQMAGRKLVVADSFAGLPKPEETDEFHRRSFRSQEGQVYQKGQFEGSLDEVKENIARFGELSVCTFVPGYYNESLPKLANENEEARYVFAFLDVDLFQSTLECLLYLWPRLQEGCRLYTDDGDDIDLAAIFFEREWWQKTFGEGPPGLFGAGNGINFLQGQTSQVGLAIKGHHLLSENIERYFTTSRAL